MEYDDIYERKTNNEDEEKYIESKTDYWANKEKEKKIRKRKKLIKKTTLFIIPVVVMIIGFIAIRKGNLTQTIYTNDNYNSYNNIYANYQCLQYYRSLFSADDSKIYDKIANAVGNCEETIEVSVSDAEILGNIVLGVSYDNPQYFWFDGSYSYVNTNGLYTVNFKYLYSKNEIENKQTRLENTISNIYLQANNLSDYEKVVLVHNFIVNNTIYDRNSDEQTCYSVLVNNKGVCAGYARAMKLLLDILEVDCIYATGIGKGESHAWNIVKVEDNWYQVDCTWDDPVTNDGVQQLRYNYLLITDDEIFIDHQYDEDNNYPKCATIDNNYFFKEGRYLTGYDENVILRIFTDDFSKKNTISFKCANKNVYKICKTELIDNKKVYEIFAKAQNNREVISSYHYSCDDDLLIIEITPDYKNDPKEFSIDYLDVGQADAAIINCDGHYMMIDGGNVNDSQFIYSYLKNNAVKSLDCIVCTHPHEDHVGGLAAALNCATVGKVYCSTSYYDSDAFKNFKKYVNKQGLEIIVPSQETFYLGSAVVDLYAPIITSNTTSNNSIVTRISFEDKSFIFMGDDEFEDETAFLDYYGENFKSDVIKVAHHGSNNATKYRLLYAVSPQYAVISVGANNSYGHPSDETLKLLSDAGVKVLRTDLNGTIHFGVENSSIVINTEK